MSVDVFVEAPAYVLTKEELRRKTEEMKNKIHAVLREFGYDVSEIKVGR